MSDIELTLKRLYKKKDYTIGVLSINGVPFCHILEPPVGGTHHGVTAIPAGRYEIDMSIVSPKYKDRTWAKRYDGIVPTLKDVPGRSRILMHVGNTIWDTDGCLLPGHNREKGKVLESTVTYYYLMDNVLIPAAKRGQRVFITIID